MKRLLLLGLGAVAGLAVGAGIHASPVTAAPGYDCSLYAKWGQATVDSCEQNIKGLPPANGNGGPCQNIAAITGHNQSECG
jgi:hypothetical protein